MFTGLIKMITGLRSIAQSRTGKTEKGTGDIRRTRPFDHRDVVALIRVLVFVRCLALLSRGFSLLFVFVFVSRKKPGKLWKALEKGQRNGFLSANVKCH